MTNRRALARMMWRLPHVGIVPLTVNGSNSVRRLWLSVWAAMEMELHPLAELFPPMPGDQFAELVADITACGKGLRSAQATSRPGTWPAVCYKMLGYSRDSF